MPLVLVRESAACVLGPGMQALRTQPRHWLACAIARQAKRSVCFGFAFAWLLQRLQRPKE